MREKEDLDRILSQIDGRGYKAYREIAGAWNFDGLSLFLDYVQGDPFAPPSRLRVRLPSYFATIPGDWTVNRLRQVAAADFLARRFRKQLQRTSSESVKRERIYIDAGGQEVLERTAVIVTPDFVEARIEASLPAAGRRILGRQAFRLLAEVIPAAARRALVMSPETLAEGDFFWKTVENQETIRGALEERGLVAFVADGAILPRESGVSDRPMRSDHRIPFRSPDSLRVSFDLPHPASRDSGERTISGMGIPRGVTIIAGGGYHGKSTLLRALERCVYPHVPGDGREYVVTDPTAAKVRAEDRRRIEGVDISPFINNLPNGQPTSTFRTDEASGSTSQAAAIIEAIEAGSRVLLIDEDTSATNLLIRDSRMRALVEKTDEPITPFVDRVRQLQLERDISTIIVMGGSGDYFDIADKVIVMSGYCPEDRTERAREIAAKDPARQSNPKTPALYSSSRRIPLPKSIDPSRGTKDARIDARSPGHLIFGRHDVDLRAVEQFVETSQTRAAGFALYLAARRLMSNATTLPEILDELENLLDAEGVDVLDPYMREDRSIRQHPGNFSRPRRHEIAATLNRLRSLEIAGR